MVLPHCIVDVEYYVHYMKSYYYVPTFEWISFINNLIFVLNKSL